MTSFPAATTWQQRAVALTIDGRAVIDGERRDSASGKRFTSCNPATGSALAEVALCDSEDVDRAVASGRRVFESGQWSRADAEERKAALLRLADLMESRAAEFALLETLDMGKPVSQSSTVDVPGSIATFRWYAELTDKLVGEIPATPRGSVALVTKEPLGVVGAIVPWNYPLEIATWKLAPALAVGNSVVLKPAVESSLTALLLGELAIEAGLPAGVVNVVPGSGALVGKALGLHPDVNALAFTGSTAVSKLLLGYSAASNLKRLSLEAGGKSSNLIFADTVDLELAAVKAAFGAFYNQGEVCSSNSRILVERSIYNEFIERFAVAASAYEPGDPLNLGSGNGALVNEKHADSVQKAVEIGRADGRLVHGGQRLKFDGSTAFMQPTIIADLPNEHELHRTEVFGPLAVVTAFDTEDEAIWLANNTVYGLAASVWTANLARAHRVASRLIAGTVSVNTVDAIGLTTPFGGFRQSGFGRDLSAHALDNYVGLKTTWIQYG